MRLIFVSNYYPPATHGGYELWCQEVATELVSRGHEVRVLTSCLSGSIEQTDDLGVPVYRWLHLQVEDGLAHTVTRLLKDRHHLEREDLRRTEAVVQSIQPDLAVIWGMWNIPRAVPALLEQLLPGRVVYYLSDYWPSLPNAYIQRLRSPSRRRSMRLAKCLLSKPFLAKLETEPPIDLKLQHPICVSRGVREELVRQSVPVAHAKIIHGGIQADGFIEASKNRHSTKSEHLRLLYVGRLEPEKGVHTAVRALGLIVGREDGYRVTLDIVGKGDRGYEAELEELVQSNQLNGLVSFEGWVPYSELPDVMAQRDALIYPSEWQEPFGRTVLEGLASGLVVIGTTTGVAADILTENETGLIFPTGDAEELARQIKRLATDSALRKRLAKAGQHCVQKGYTLANMVDQIESALLSIEESQ